MLCALRLLLLGTRVLLLLCAYALLLLLLGPRVLLLRLHGRACA